MSLYSPKCTQMRAHIVCQQHVHTCPLALYKCTHPKAVSLSNHLHEWNLWFIATGSTSSTFLMALVPWCTAPLAFPACTLTHHHWAAEHPYRPQRSANQTQTLPGYGLPSNSLVHVFSSYEHSPASLSLGGCSCRMEKTVRTVQAPIPRTKLVWKQVL